MSEIADPATVLVIEDDPSLNAALAATLKAAGYRPVTATTRPTSCSSTSACRTETG
jgi:two-component system, OmpR family, KDP operon response regulator KdpE